jgi:hypothetical protein
MLLFRLRTIVYSYGWQADERIPQSPLDDTLLILGYLSRAFLNERPDDEWAFSLLILVHKESVNLLM